jgi:hypothetical protein
MTREPAARNWRIASTCQPTVGPTPSARVLAGNPCPPSGAAKSADRTDRIETVLTLPGLVFACLSLNSPDLPYRPNELFILLKLVKDKIFSSHLTLHDQSRRQIANFYEVRHAFDIIRSQEQLRAS